MKSSFLIRHESELRKEDHKIHVYSPKYSLLVLKSELAKSSYCVNWSAKSGFSPLRKTESLHVKNDDQFKLRVFEIFNQLLTRHSLYLAP